MCSMKYVCFSTGPNSLHIIDIQWKSCPGDQLSTRYSLPPSCLNCCRRQSDGYSGQASIRGCWIRHLSVYKDCRLHRPWWNPNRKARLRWAIVWIWILFVMRNGAWLYERVFSEGLAVVHVVQHTNLAFGRSAWSTATNTAQFNDADDLSRTKVPGSAGSLAFGAIDLEERKPVAFVRLVTSVCKYLQHKRYPHCDLCPIDSCLNLISVLDSGNGVMGMRNLRISLLNDNPHGNNQRRQNFEKVMTFIYTRSHTANHHTDSIFQQRTALQPRNAIAHVFPLFSSDGQSSIFAQISPLVVPYW